MMYVHNVVAFCVVRGDDSETWEGGRKWHVDVAALAAALCLTKGNG